MNTNEINFRVYTTNNIQDIEKDILPSESDKRPMLLLDGDDTSIKTGSKKAAHLGGVQWRTETRKYLPELKESHGINTHLFECLTLFIAQSLPTKAVQKDKTAEAVKNAERKGCSVFVFTARGIAGAKAWYNINISGVDTLTKAQIEQAGITIKEDPHLPSHDNLSGKIIFAQNQPKDKLITSLFQKKDEKPPVFDPTKVSQILFADDKKDAVDSVGKAAKELGIDYVGVHYTRVEEIEKKRYHSLKSMIQLVRLLEGAPLLEKKELAEYCAKIEEKQTAEQFFKDILVRFDRALATHGVYQQTYSNVQELFENMKQAVSGRFANIL